MANKAPEQERVLTIEETALRHVALLVARGAPAAEVSKAVAELVATAISDAEARDALTKAADEQGALRRVATLVAASAAPSEVFAAVTREVAIVLGGNASLLCRAEPDGDVVVVGTWANNAPPAPPGFRIPRGGTNVTTIVLDTGRPGRVDNYDADATGDAGDVGRFQGVRSAVGVPIHVEGHLWGLVVVGATGDDPLPPDAEERLAAFTELVAIAIANAESGEALSRLADEQAALRRIATLVARGVEPERVFATVAEETATTFQALTQVMRFEHDPPSSVIVGASKGTQIPIGTRWQFLDVMASADVYRTGRSARLGAVDWASHADAAAEKALRFGVNSQVASPILVEGTLWGAISLNAREELPPDTEQRLEKFTELVTTAIANAAARAELVASRARIVAAGDEARRRIERDLHDGTQQRLIALGLDLQGACAAIPEEERETRAALLRAQEDIEAILVDLRELSHGLHPPLLSRLGLGPSLQALARRSPIPLHLDIDLPERPASSLETALYYVISEAVTNAIKHSHASDISIAISSDATLRASIVDDGIGGADPGRGSGLTGLVDRVDALGGRFALDSPAHGGTRISIELPADPT